MKRVDVATGVIWIHEVGDPPLPRVLPTPEELFEQKVEEASAVDWAGAKREKEEADAVDATVQALIDDMRDLKTEVKAAPSGALILTKAQVLTVLRATLYLLKGDKSS